MSKTNIGSVVIKAVVDATDVRTGANQAADGLGQIPKAANEAEAKLDRLRKGFLDVARAAKTAKEATGQASAALLRPVPGGAGNFFRNAGGRTRGGLGLDALAGARQEARDFQEAERIFETMRRREQKLAKGAKSTYGVLAPGQSTAQERQRRREERAGRRAAGLSLLGGESYGLLGDGPAAAATPATDPNAAKRARIAFSLAEQRRREAAAARGESQDAAARRSRVAASLGRQRQLEEDLERSQAAEHARRRSRVAFSLAEQKRGEDEARRQNGFFGRAGAFGRRAGEGGRNVVAGTLGGIASGGGVLGGLAGGVGGFAGSLFGSTIGTLVGSGLGKIAGTVAGAAGRVVSTGLSLFEQAAVKAITEGSKREDAEVSFGALLGSSKEGKALVGDVTDLAVRSPFGSGELLDQSKLLLSYGVAAGDVTRTLSRLGDVASGAGTDLGRLSLAYGQVMAKGRLQGQELNQFTEAGVGVGDFADAYGEMTGRQVSVNQFLQLSEQGRVSASVVERAFERMTSAGGRFFGMMDDRSRTFSGRLQALRESVDVFAGKVGKSFIDNTGVGDFLDKVAGKVQGQDTKGLDRFFRGLDRTGGAFLGRVGGGVQGLLGGGGDFFTPNWEKFDERLGLITDQAIPSMLDAGSQVVAGFLDVSAAALRFGGLLDSLVPLDKVASTEKDLIDTKKNNALLQANGLQPDFARQRALEENLAKFRQDRLDRAAELAARGKMEPYGLAEDLERRAANARLARLGDQFRAGAKPAGGFFGELIGPKAKGVLGDVGFGLGRVFGNPENLRAQGEARRLNRLAVADGRADPDLKAGDVLTFNDLAGKARDGIGGLSKQFDELAERAVPGFSFALDGLNKKLQEPRDDRPLEAFNRDMGAIAFGRLKGMIGLPGGLNAAEADRGKLLALDALRAKVKQPLGDPPPLLRANSQDAQSAITKAMNAYTNSEKPTLEALLKQAKEQEAAQKIRDDAALGELHAIAKRPGGFNFIGLPFGNPK